MKWVGGRQLLFFLLGVACVCLLGAASSAAAGANEEPHTLSIPGMPAGPTILDVGEVGTYTSTGATCSLGHPVHYAFQWGDGTVSATWLATPADEKNWSVGGSYGVTLVAVCSEDQSVASVSETLPVFVDHSVTVPGTPTGPVILVAGAAGTYMSTGAMCSLGHPVLYAYQWGDGTFSASWLSAPTDSKSWSQGGSYAVTLIAACSEDQRVLNTSGALLVHVDHTLSTPGTPMGPAILAVGEEGTYSSTGATCSLGHPVQYAYQWGDGTVSGSWLTTPTDTKSWTPGGTYNVVLIAVCSEDQSVAGYSGPLQVHVDHSVSTPGAPAGPVSLDIDELGTYTSAGAVCSLGHAVDYVFLWGDGTNSGQWLSAPEDSKSWRQGGSYAVTVAALCHEDYSLISMSEPLMVYVVHTLSKPGRPTGPIRLDIGETGTFTSEEATCSLGHPVQYVYQWGDGTYSESWLDMPVDSKHWDSGGSYAVVVAAVCSKDNSLINASDPLMVYAGHTLTSPGPITGPVSLAVDEVGTYTGGASLCSLGHTVEYAFQWGDGTGSGSWLSLPEDSKSWNPGGSYAISLVAVCSKDYSLMRTSEPMVVHVGHTVSAPNPLTGPGRLEAGEMGTFTGGVSTCSLGHAVEYVFQWGDGTGSGSWLSLPEDSKSWAPGGIFGVTLVAACSADHSVFQVSDSLVVNVGHALSVAGTPEGPFKLAVDETGTFTSPGALCTLGHAVHYKFQWGDGTESATWLNIPSDTKSWGVSGIYEVTLLAACSQEPSVTRVSAALRVRVGNAYTADQNDDGQISLSEMLRVIQLFNSNGYHCEAGTEDDYAPGPGGTACAGHASDYTPQDWVISLSELLQVIQFFNSGGYHACPGTENGFCPGLD